jgi:hypothetical protein
VLTPALSLSTTHPGTNQPPFAAIKIDVVDSGNTAVAGIDRVSATFCLADSSRCISVTDNEASQHHAKSGFLRLGGQISPGYHTPGVYKLHNVSLGDRAGNVQFLMSTEFGGVTDFSAYFPSTTITLNP